MIRNDVKSSNLAAMGYDADTQVLEVVFVPNRDGHKQVHAYEGVSPELFEKLRTANENGLSLGSIFHHQVRNCLKGRKIAVIIDGVEQPIETT